MNIEKLNRKVSKMLESEEITNSINGKLEYINLKERSKKTFDKFFNVLIIGTILIMTTCYVINEIGIWN
jgi:hypothetical protein